MTTALTWRATPRRASRRVQANDAEILDAGVRVISDRGWGGFTSASVARSAGLSKRALSTRYLSRGALAADTWTQRCEPALKALWSEVTTAHGDALVDSLMRVTSPTAEQRAGIELLLIASYNPDLRAATEAFRTWLTDERRSVPRATAARQTYAGAVALGIIMASRDPIVPPSQMTEQFRRLATALTVDVEPLPLPEIPAEHLRGAPRFDTGDEITDSLLGAALDLITDEGFDGASVLRICERAGVSEGALFNRYPSKVALLKDAVALAHAAGFAINNDFLAAIARDHGPGMAEAVILSHLLASDTRRPVIMHLEQARVSWHHRELATALRTARDEAIDREHATPDVLADRHLGLATGYGFMLMNLLDAAAWTLPFDVVSRPLEGDHEGG